MPAAPLSPYARALGERLDLLHPVLREYFAGVPADAVGIGEGVFHRVGTPRRQLWPVLRLLERRGVIVACWEQEVPFRVENRTIAGRAVGEREFRLTRGTWTMRDAVAATPGGRVVDELGEPGLVAACFDLDVRDGRLRMRSRAVGFRLGRLRLRLPRLLSPVVELTESFDDETQRQRVALTITAPLIGRIYEYDGDFEYRLESQGREGGE